MNVIRSVTMANGNAVLTGLDRTEDLATGLFVYGSGIPLDCQITSVDSHTQATMTKKASISQTVNVEFTTADAGMYHDRICALIDVKAVCDEYGDLVAFLNRTESDIDRDIYGSVYRRSQTPVIMLKAHPVEFNPSEKKLEKAGILEKCDVVIYTAQQDWITAGVDYNKIEMAARNTVKLQGNTYEVRQKGLAGQFADTFLYITFGLQKQ